MDPIVVSEAFSTHRAVRVTVRLEACWAHAICTRSAPLWAKSKMLEEFRLSGNEVRTLTGSYFQNDSHYVTRDAQLLVAHGNGSLVAEQWVERSGHHWSLWRDGDARASDGVGALFVVQSGWLGNGPRKSWVAHEALLRRRRLVVGEGPFVEAHIEKKGLSKRLPPGVISARVGVSLVPDGGGVVDVTMAVTHDAEGVAEKVRALLSDENGFMLRLATRDVLSGAVVRATEADVSVTIPVSALQATSMLALAGAYVGADAEP
jgi:hypothetical protein